MAHYTITPLEKKSAYAEYEMYRENPNGSISTLKVEECWRFGRGFIEDDSYQNLRPSDQIQYCHMDEAGENESCEFSDLILANFYFSDDVHQKDRDSFKSGYYDESNEFCGTRYIYEGDHEWQIEDKEVIICPPLKVELCDENGSCIRKVKLRSKAQIQNLWKKHGPGVLISADAGIKPGC